jgi:hypothetical protein
MATPKADLVLAPVDALETSVAGFNKPLAGFIASLNLPTDGVLVPIDERRLVIQSLEAAITVLPIQERAKAAYLSKFVVAVTIGLFDAALNYLWNETVAALRRLVATTDLSYFFDVAEKRSEYRKRLVVADDLAAVEDASLLDACARIGLLSDVNRERLRHVNYMRNHASAAHPNQIDLNGAEMIGWLSNCLRCAITAKPDVAVLQTQRLLLTVREHPIEARDASLLAADIRKLPQDRVDDLLWTLFGIYTDERSASVCRTNIEMLAPPCWRAATEPRRYEVGTRHTDFVRRGEQARKQLAQDFLKHVGGEGYRSEDVLAAELIEKLRGLHAAHRGWNNFYTEWPHAVALESSLPQNGIVPKAALYAWVFTLGECFIGNGMGYREGVDEAALPHLQKHIDRFGDRETAEFLRLFTVDEFTGDFSSTKPDQRARALAGQLAQRSQDVFVRQGLALIQAAPTKTLRVLGATAPFKTMLASLPSFA